MKCPECRLSGGMHYSGCPEEPDETEEEAEERQEREDTEAAQREDAEEAQDEGRAEWEAANPVKDEKQP